MFIDGVLDCAALLFLDCVALLLLDGVAHLRKKEEDEDKRDVAHLRGKEEDEEKRDDWWGMYLLVHGVAHLFVHGVAHLKW